ncbi:MAG TPA: UDP-N-acetylmuramoyl-L-alanyl-D-glutamate--2,6-diaminopimelate ligase, partial [Candidatus Handelsmanbacteria bacterium]|nr:UDP-N-acetylmuramoyl-L-alanyl-D-glutamate--2,6-diaminopimelate ligase [Candidatus Handelsmanbacteria bacterium]
KTIGVTGTNGKSTTVSMLAAIVCAAEQPNAWLSTLGAYVNGREIRETDPSRRFLRMTEEAVASGVRTLALEVTSKALKEGFAQRWPPSVAVFTNLSRDHLDLHENPEHYLASKAQLFISLLPGGIAVLNADDDNAALIADVVPEGRSIQRYSAQGNAAQLSAERIEISLKGTRVVLSPSSLAEALGGELLLQVVGDVHAANALAAAVSAASVGYSANAIKQGLKDFRTLPGRFEIVAQTPLVVVDYAHTPDGLQGTLCSARSLVGESGKLICVFGCGGNRDRGKRPMMGAVADLHADHVILTGDNPRYEDLDEINGDVLAGANGAGAKWQVEKDRGRAIALALDVAGAQDIVIIAGKGHEQFQDVGGSVRPFSDTDVVRRYLVESRENLCS